MSDPKSRWEDFYSGCLQGPLLFAPAVYDLKPALVGVPACRFGQDADELKAALEREVEAIQADVLTVGYDIYNVEAEACGCCVRRDPDLPMPLVEEPLLSEPEEVERLKGLPVDPSGRMPLFLDAARWAVQRFGWQIPVRGAVSGPFSMAAVLCRRQGLLAAALEKPGSVERLLSWCTERILAYARGFRQAGAGVVVFDSFASPPLISPRLYRELVLPCHRRLFHQLRESGLEHRPLVMGGNIAPLLSAFPETGATQFLLDFNIPLPRIREILETSSGLFRVNLSPRLVAEGSREEVAEETRKVLGSLRGLNNYLLGTGILPYATPLDNIAAIRRAVLES